MAENEAELDTYQQMHQKHREQFARSAMVAEIGQLQEDLHRI